MWRTMQNAGKYLTPTLPWVILSKSIRVKPLGFRFTVMWWWWKCCPMMFTQQEDSTACRTQASLSDSHLCQSGSWRQNPDWKTPKTWQSHVGQSAFSSIRCRTQQKLENSYSGAFQIQVSRGGGSDTQHFIPSHFNEKPLKIPHHLQLDRCWHFSTSVCVIDNKITSAPSVIRLHYTVTRCNPSPLFSCSKKCGIWTAENILEFAICFSVEVDVRLLLFPRRALNAAVFTGEQLVKELRRCAVRIWRHFAAESSDMKDESTSV